MASNDLELALRIRAAFEGQQALTNLATSFVDINKKVETLMRGLQAISGSAEGAVSEFTYLEEVSKKFGLSVLDLADNYVKLSASAKETNLEGEATRKLFEATASTMAVLGGDTVTTERAFRALGQIMSKGQVYAEELKGQLAEAIPGALQIMSRGLGISTNEMLRLMEAGQLSADVLLPFATQLEKEYGNLASSSTTFAQAINRIQTEWTLLMNRIGDTGAWSAITSVLTLLGNNASVLAGLVGVGLVAAFVKAISVTKGLAVSIIDSVRSFQLQGTAAEVAAKAVLDKANADALAATRAVQSAEASAASARASLLSATTAANAANASVAAQERLVAATIRNQLASEGLSAAKIKETEALITANLAANNYARSQSVMSRAMALLTGPAGMIALIIAGFAAMAYAFKGQDEATKTLSKSTEEYTQELEKLTAAQINLVNARAKEQAADNQSRIDTIKEELEFLYKKLEAERQGIEVNREKSISWYGFKNVLSNVFSTEEQLAQAQADLDEATKNLTITEAKRSIGIGALANQYLLLQKTTQEQQASLNDVNRDWLEQNKIVDASKKTYLDLVNLTGLYSAQSIEAHKNVGQAVEGLQAIEQKRKDQLLLSKNTQTQVTTAIEAYAEELGVSADAVRAGISGDQQAINQLDAKSKAIALSVQSLLRLTEEEKALAAQVKLTKAELEKYEKVQLSGVEAKLREATAIGDLNAIRQAEIEKAKVQQTVAQKSLELEQTILSDKQKQLAIDEQLYQQNEKGRPKTQERIDKLKLEITAQEGVVAQKQADIVVTDAQAASAVRANSLIGASMDQQKKALIAAKAELFALRETYQSFEESGQSIDVLNVLLERIRKKEEEVGEQAKNMKGDMVTAFNAVGLSYEEVLTGMDFDTRRAIDLFGALTNQAEITSKDIKKAFTNVLSQADTEEELEALRQKLIELGNNGKLSSEEVSTGLLQIRQRAQEIAADPSFAAVQEALAKIREETARGIELGNRERESLQGRIQSAIELAKAKGDEAEAARLSALATKEEVDQAEQRIQQLQRQQGEIDAHIQRVYAQANADGVYTDEERKVVAALQDKSVAIGQDIAQIEAKLPLQQREAEEAARAAGPIGQLTRLYQEQADEHQRAAQVSERYTDVRLKELDGELRVAQAKKDEAEVARLQAEQQRVLIEQADQIAANRAQEATDAEKAVSAKTLELVADGELSKADRQQIADLEAVAATKRAASIEAANHANALRAEADAGRELPTVWEDANQRIQRMAKSADQAVKDSAENARAAGSIIDQFYNGAISVLASLSESAVAQFKKMRGEVVPTGDALDVVRQRIEQTEQGLARMGTGGGSRFIVWLGQITRDAVEVQKAFLGQAQAAESLTERLEAVGAGAAISADGMDTLIRQAQVSKDGFDLLDDTRLSNLQSAIDRANDKLREMQEETQSAQDRLAELNAEILEAQGQDQQAALLRQQLDYQQQLAELERQRSEAQAAGNQELLRILREQETKLRTLNDLKVKNIQADQSALSATDKTRSQVSALADEAERAGRAMRGLSDLNWSGMNSQVGEMAGHFAKMSELL